MVDDTRAGRDAFRRTDEIETDILDIRSRLNSTLSEIERRLQPDQLAGTALGLVRSLAEGRPHPIGDAIRRNPVPAVIAGIGLAWLAVEVLRGEQPSPPLLPGTPGGRRLTDRPTDGKHAATPPAITLLHDLIGVARQGTRALRQAGMALPDGPARMALRRAAEERGRTAALLQDEVLALGWPSVHGDAPNGDLLPAWQQVEALVPGSNATALLEAIAVAEAETLARFRTALKRDLPDDLRIILGGRFHEVEQTRARLLALHDAVQ